MRQWLYTYDLFNVYFATAANQFGFKSGIGCTHAVFCVKNVINSYVMHGNTANILALDIAKAFPRVNHFALLSKLIARKAPLCLVNLLESWLTRSRSKVRWCGVVSGDFSLRVGVNQGSVLAPALFGVFINDVLVTCNAKHIGAVFVYADDILIVTKSLSTVQCLFDIVQLELAKCNMNLNVSKCCAMRVGPRFDAGCANITTVSGLAIVWVKEIRYLGAFLVAGRVLRFSVACAKAKFNRAVNSILSKVASVATEDLILHLIKVKCMPILLYSLEVCDLNKSTLAALDFCVMRFGFRIFRTGNRDVVRECFDYFNFSLPSVLIASRYSRFLSKLALW